MTGPTKTIPMCLDELLAAHEKITRAWYDKHYPNSSPSPPDDPVNETEPETIAELQAAIGRLQAKLHYKVCGDQTVGVSDTQRGSS